MKIIANLIKVGNVVEYNNQQLLVLKREHIRTGKGGAYIQLETKDVTTGSRNNFRLRSEESVEKVHIDEQKVQFQYFEGSNIVMMDMNNLEQIFMPKEILGEDVAFLSDNMEVSIQSYNDKPMSISLPEMVMLEVKDTNSFVKNQTVTSSYKPAIMENGIKVQVPQFVNPGDKIIVRTEDRTYVKRAND